MSPELPWRALWLWEEAYTELVSINTGGYWRRIQRGALLKRNHFSSLHRGVVFQKAKSFPKSKGSFRVEEGEGEWFDWLPHRCLCLFTQIKVGGKCCSCPGEPISRGDLSRPAKTVKRPPGDRKKRCSWNSQWWSFGFNWHVSLRSSQLKWTGKPKEVENPWGQLILW